MADSSQEGSSQSRNPSPARDRSSDGESDGEDDRSSRQEISEVRVRRYRLRVPSLAVRPFYCPKNVHTSGTGRRRLPQDMRGQSVPISGRLARRRRVIRPNPTIPIPGPHLVQEIGFLINEEKSDWVPTQFPSFLGSSLDLVRALALITLQT